MKDTSMKFIISKTFEKSVLSFMRPSKVNYECQQFIFYIVTNFFIKLISQKSLIYFEVGSWDDSSPLDFASFFENCFQKL